MRAGGGTGLQVGSKGGVRPGGRQGHLGGVHGCPCDQQAAPSNVLASGRHDSTAVALPLRGGRQSHKLRSSRWKARGSFSSCWIHGP